MTLFRQIALLISVSFFLLATILMVSNFSRTGEFLQGQLQSSAQDMTTTLGVAISNLPDSDDRASLEVLFNSIFDSGYYTKIELVGVDGHLIHKKSQILEVRSVPDWFIKWIPLEEARGSTRVVKGWIQLGQLEVSLHPGFAYIGLYQNFKTTLLWFVVLFLFSILLLWQILRVLLAPLQKITEQAEAIQKNQFFQQETLPTTVDLRRVVEAMNRMVSKMQGVFKDQQQTLDHYQELLYQDKLTGLGNRRFLLEQLQQVVSEESSFHGSLAMIKIVNYDAVKEIHGYEISDDLAVSVAGLLNKKLVALEKAKKVRLSENEFVILVSSDEESVKDIILQFYAMFLKLINDKDLSKECHLAAGITPITTGQIPGELLSDVDYSLTLAINQGPYSIEVSKNQSFHLPQGKIQWRAWLMDIIESKRLFLVGQSAFNSDLQVTQKELFIRTHNAEGHVIPASAFMPMAASLDLAPEIDKAVFLLVKDNPKIGNGVPLALNLSAGFFEKAELHEEFNQLLEYTSERNIRLCIEASHHVLLLHPRMCNQISDRIHKNGHKFGVDNIDLAQSLSILQSSSCDYVKISAATLQEMNTKETSSRYQALKTLTDTFDVSIIAVGVDSQKVFDELRQLGIELMQGNFLHEPEVMKMAPASE